ncbi:LolA-related protein [Dokdonella ginsengisoli]|uniref:LolA-related protein n=1 Tax=Dokdonella ginsengisoli TaxID=363846 RepID=A0ABV9QXB6_9GAMM
MTTSTPLPSRAAPPEAGPDAAAIVAGLKRETPARTAYTEVRYSGMLDRPLILRGELEYLGAGRLGKRVEQPYREQTTIADGSATIRRGEREPRTFALGQAPELEGFLRGFTALLGGDAQTLQHDFTLTASGSAANWQLQLKPRDARLARRVRAIEVDGANGTPRCFRTHEGDGDLAILLVDTLAATKLTTRPAKSELDLLCRGAPAR